MKVKPYSVKFFFYYVALDDDRSLNFKKFLIGGKLLYNVVLVSAIQKCK